MPRRMKACRRAGQLADRVHGPVLYLLIRQNRELPYASQRSKPDKVQVKRETIKMEQILLSGQNKLAEGLAVLRQSRDK